MFPSRQPGSTFPVLWRRFSKGNLYCWNNFKIHSVCSHAMFLSLVACRK